VNGHLAKETLGELSVKRAKEKAMKTWASMKPKPIAEGTVTLGAAVVQYMEAKPLAAKTRSLMQYNLDRYLMDWKGRSMEDIGRDRAGVRALQQRITTNHGPATANQTAQLLSAVYRWCRKVNTDLPESPMIVVEKHKIKPRDWAYSPEGLKAWWCHIQRDKEGKPVEDKKGKPAEKGVSTLGVIKRMWWLVALFTGARKGSIEALRWTDVDLDKKTIHFRVTKGDRPYKIPMSDALAQLLVQYRGSGDVPPSEWLFPSPIIEGGHIVDVKNIREGVGPAHRLRHTFRTTLAELAASPDHSRMLMGHSMGGDVSRGYITSSLVVESLRPITNAVSKQYMQILNLTIE
jgi:integrase